MRTSITHNLLVLAIEFVIALVLSYIATKLLTPILFPYWGVILIMLLGLWSANSVMILLKNAVRTIRLGMTFLLTVITIIMSNLAIGGLIGILLILLSTVLLGLTTIAIAILKLFRHSISPRLLLLGFLPMLIGSISVGIINLTPAPSALPPQTMAISEEIQYLYEADQSDRATGRFVLDTSRDRQRLQRILSLDQQQQINTPEAQYQAAMLLQHGSCPDHFRRAYELFAEASQAGITNAESLAHASYDRWMLAIGKPQKYNTQLAVNQSKCYP